MKLTTTLLLRVALGIIFITHSIQRFLIYKTVDDFGGFLNAMGFPAGVVLAWAITIYELVGGSLLIANRYVRYISAGFILHQVMGIILVHARNGWFVVGAGTGGMEYSFLLIVCLVGLLLGKKD